jgi:hypothetical protein
LPAATTPPLYALSLSAAESPGQRLESTNGGVSLPRVIVELDQVTRHFRADIQEKQVHAITLLKRPFDCALVDGVHVRSNARESDLPLRKIPFAKNGSDTFGFVPIGPLLRL